LTITINNKGQGIHFVCHLKTHPCDDSINNLKRSRKYRISEPHTLFLTVFLVSKGKAIPLEAWTGPEGSRRLRLPDFKTIGT
jgi:hypothetical protein